MRLDFIAFHLPVVDIVIKTGGKFQPVHRARRDGQGSR
jgi:hypothetical protein